MAENVMETYFGQQSLQALHLVLAGVQLATGQLEERRAEL